MTCVTHKQAEHVCLNPECKASCSYICIDPESRCRVDHEACSMASLAFLMRKANKASAKGQDFLVDRLRSFYEGSKKIMEQIEKKYANFRYVMMGDDLSRHIS